MDSHINFFVVKFWNKKVNSFVDVCPYLFDQINAEHIFGNIIFLKKN